MGGDGTSNWRIAVSICDSFAADDDSLSRPTQRSTYKWDLEDLLRFDLALRTLGDF